MKIDEEKSLAIGTGVILNKIDGEFYEDKIKAYALVENLISNGARGNVYRVKYISENNNVKDAILKEFFPSEKSDYLQRVYFEKQDNSGFEKVTIWYYGAFTTGPVDEINYSFDRFINTNTSDFEFIDETPMGEMKKSLAPFIVPIERVADDKFANYECFDNSGVLFRGFYITQDNHVNSLKYYLDNDNYSLEDKNAINLLSRLEVFRCLVETVRNFYAGGKGYVITDLKPDNFAYSSKKGVSEKDFVKNVYLLDMDAAVKADSVENGNFGYTFGYCKKKSDFEHTPENALIYSCAIIFLEIIFKNKFNQYYEKEMSLGKEVLIVFDINDENRFNNNILENAFNSIEFLSGEEKEYIKRILQNCVDRRFKQTMYKNLDKFINDIERLIRVISNNGVDPIIMQKRAKNIATEFKNELKDFDEGLLCDCVVVDDETE